MNLRIMKTAGKTEREAWELLYPVFLFNSVSTPSKVDDSDRNMRIMGGSFIKGCFTELTEGGADQAAGHRVDDTEQG